MQRDQRVDHIENMGISDTLCIICVRIIRRAPILSRFFRKKLRLIIRKILQISTHGHVIYIYIYIIRDKGARRIKLIRLLLFTEMQLCCYIG